MEYIRIVPWETELGTIGNIRLEYFYDNDVETKFIFKSINQDRKYEVRFDGGFIGYKNTEESYKINLFIMNEQIYRPSLRKNSC